jgi:hypothetical protein
MPRATVYISPLRPGLKYYPRISCKKNCKTANLGRNVICHSNVEFANGDEQRLQHALAAM